MTRLDWGLTAPRRYESGVDRGVLYPPNSKGVAWNGLVSVEESHLGGEVSAYYFDGIKYLEKQESKHFQASITAFTAPHEFSELMGELHVIPGFILTRQPRRQFGFSYRTMIGDSGDYKIHIVYNATATPQSRGYSTLADAVEATSFTWQIDAVPPPSSSFKPSAHFVIDTTKTDPFTVRAIEDILYGTEDSALIDGNTTGITDGGDPDSPGTGTLDGDTLVKSGAPRLPSVEELVDIVGLWEPKLIVPAVEPIESVTNLLTNPQTERTTERFYGLRVYETLRDYVGQTIVLSFEAKADAKVNDLLVYPYQTSGISISTDAHFVITTEWQRFTMIRTVYQWSEVPDSRGYSDGEIGFYDLNNDLIDPALMLHLRNFSITLGAEILPYFSGDTPDDLEYTYEWTGTPHASTSVRKTRPVAYLTPGLGDLTPSKVPGIYRDLPTSRLAETTVGGLYRLE